MISILHLSNLHLVQNADWSIIRRTILDQARLLHDRPRREKLPVITNWDVECHIERTKNGFWG